MIKKTFIGSGSNLRASALQAIMNFDEYIRQFNNVEFVEAYEVGTDCYRYIYRIDGCENLYYTVENNTSSSSATMSMKLKKEDQLYGSNQLAGVGSGGQTGNLVGFDAYMISYNGALKGISTTSIGSTCGSLCYFIDKDGEKYCFTSTNTASNNQPVYRDSDTAQLYLDRLFYNYSENEKALLRKANIVSTTSSPPFVTQIDDMWLIMNSNFQQFSNALVDIDGVRYRQWGTNYIFVLDGDTE